MASPNQADARQLLAEVIRKLERDGDEHGVTEDLRTVGTTLDELIEQSQAAPSFNQKMMKTATSIVDTLAMPTFCRQSTKNPNAGFIDWRDYCALLGEVDQLRAQLAVFTGNARDEHARHG